LFSKCTNAGKKPKKGEIKMKKSVNMTSQQVRNLLSLALEKANNTAKKSAAGFIAFNPAHENERMRDLKIEFCGIDNLYFKILSELERIEKIG
jgi:hypothetical protein